MSCENDGQAAMYPTDVAGVPEVSAFLEPSRPNPYVPLFVDLTYRRVLVVGGGGVAQRKVGNLVRHGCIPQVIAMSFTNQLERWGREGAAQLERRGFAPGDTRGAFLVFAATSDPQVNAQIEAEARANGSLVNRTDTAASDVIVPSEVDRGRLQMAISTAGASPHLAQVLRLELEKRFDAAYEPYVDLLYHARMLICERIGDPALRPRLIRRCCEGNYLQRLRGGETVTAEEVFHDALAAEKDSA